MKRLISVLAVFVGAAVAASELYVLPEGVETRWTSFENLSGAKGQGGMANAGAKGAPYAEIAPGEEVVLLDMAGSGVVRRMWLTLRNRSPEALRSYLIRMYWDGEEKPAVEAPLGDFFGHILGEMRPFDSALFSSPEGRSMNFTIPMPFRTHAKITFVNESDEPLHQLYYDIALTVGDKHPDNMLYFHAFWHRDTHTELGRDFELLPRVEGGGRFLGAHVGILGHPDNKGWWGEGEVKMYVDGDTDWPTLVGTGTEDYVGTAYGQGEFTNRYQGSPLIDNENNRWTFYRYHVPDPVFFHEDIRVTLQQMGGSFRQTVLGMLAEGVEIQPISVQEPGQFVPLIDPPTALDDPDLPDGWTNYFRRDDVSAVAYFYLDRPSSDLPRIQPLSERIEAIAEADEEE